MRLIIVSYAEYYKGKQASERMFLTRWWTQSVLGTEGVVLKLYNAFKGSIPKPVFVIFLGK